MIQVQGLDRPFRALGVDCVPPRALPWAVIGQAFGLMVVSPIRQGPPIAREDWGDVR